MVCSKSDMLSMLNQWSASPSVAFTNTSIIGCDARSR